MLYLLLAFYMRVIVFCVLVSGIRVSNRMDPGEA